MDNENKKVLILSDGPQGRLVKEFADRKFEADVIAPNRFYCYLSNLNGRDRLYLKGDENDKENSRIKVKDYAAIVPRISGNGFDYGALITKHVSENLGIFTTASEFGLRICSNKFETCQFLSRHRIRVPKQILAHSLTDFKEAIDQVGGFPFILKMQKGSQGAGVFMIRDETDASQTLRALLTTKLDLVLSQKLDSGKVANDLRLWVIGALTGDPKIYAYKRFALADDFRSNYSLSKSGETATLTDEEKDLAIRSARALKMNVAGVDIMRDEPDKNKPYVIEVNGNPGLAGIEAVTKENIAGAVAELVINNYKKGNVWQEDLVKAFNVMDAKIMHYLSIKAMDYIKEYNLNEAKNKIDLIAKNLSNYIPESNK